jgi:precorrin-6A/cobalt-precorrin-6A reductase
MTLLLLAGTGEARLIAAQLAARGVRAVASLAGATRQPATLALPTRSGGFGGRAGFVDYLKAENISAVLDATHPFAQRISHRTAEVCAERGLPYVQFLRPAWQAQAGDKWTFLDHEAEAAEHIAEGATVFLATGLQNLEDFANLRGRKVICRRIDPPRAAFPFANGDYLVGRPPFSVEDEIKLFQKLGVNWLVVKNSGGAASRSKLDAARALGLRVALIRRPAQPEGQKVTTVAEALDWVAQL